MSLRAQGYLQGPWVLQRSGLVTSARDRPLSQWYWNNGGGQHNRYSSWLSMFAVHRSFSTYLFWLLKKGCNVQLLKIRGATFPKFELWLLCLPTTWYCVSHTQLAVSQNKISSILLTANRWQESLLIYYLPLDFWWTAVFLWHAFRNPVHRYRSRHIGRAPFIAYYSWLTIWSHWLQWFPKWVPLSTRKPQWSFKSLEREKAGEIDEWH